VLKLLVLLIGVLMSISCEARQEKEAAAAGGDSARDSFARTVDSLLLDTEMHELRAQITVVVDNPDSDDESPFSFAPLANGSPPGHHARDGAIYADIEVLRKLLGRAVPVRLDTANHRFFVGSPEAVIFGHPHGSAWFVPVKLFARQYGAYVDVNCTLATCANIWTKQMLEHARQTGAIGTAVLEAHAEGLIDIDVKRLPTG
jgi:hypothetical protein